MHHAARSVLIVDDDASIRASLADVLRDEGMRVSVAASAEEGLVLLGLIDPELVISDVRMPGMSGLDLLRLVRDRASSTRVVLMTAHDDMSTVVTALRQGASDFLSKPLDLNDLRTSLTRVFTDQEPRAVRGPAATSAVGTTSEHQVSDPVRGSTLTIRRELGGGGMSRVYLAHDEELHRDVVIKVMCPELAAGLALERFEREIRLLARLQEPHIVPLLAAGVTAAGLPYYTMPFVRGESLRDMLARPGALPLRNRLAILDDVARALAFAHGEGVVHRDIKPENVLLSFGTAVVADFGIAKAVADSCQAPPAGESAGSDLALTFPGISIGTPGYMAPEQVVADPAVDHRVDLYAWGVIAYEMIAGRHPFATHNTRHALMTAHLTEYPRPIELLAPEVPPLLAAVVMQCLEKDPRNRPQSASELFPALGERYG